MKSEELMIGDWVCVRDCETYERVESISTARISTDCSDDLLLDDNIEPIPITPEILEKNGFEYDKFIDNLYSNDSLNDRPLFIEPANGAFEIFVMNVYVKIKYVHELQHALKLCGIDKEIDLCK